MEKLYDQMMEISHNLWWSWQPEVIEILKDLDSDLWRDVNHSAIAFLKKFGKKRLEERAKELAIESRVNYAFHRLQEYMSPQRGWGATHAGPLKARPVGYFSAEFGIHESMPLYSGGLGVLAGDHIKGASDLGVPVVGVGLFYDQGYFKQQINSDGWQQESYGKSDMEMLPLKQARDKNGQVLTIKLDTRVGPLHAGVLTVQVGRSLLVLLDPRVEENVEEDRALAGHLERLYGGDQKVRLRQELLLGVGGLRALRALGIDPGVLHLNEGHCAFAVLEAIRQAMQEQGMDFSEASKYVAARTVFTTHTPVEAGHDRFPPALVEEHLGLIREEIGIDEKTLLGLGRLKLDDPDELFCMTVLALKLSNRKNGVSAIHGGVSRRMWNPLWSERAEHEVPIGHITNGVHVSSWLAPQMRRLYDRHLGRDWMDRIRRREVWRGIKAVDDGELWETHRFLKGHLIDFVRRRLLAQAGQRGDDAGEAGLRAGLLNPDTLTIGFARRFALYKRASLFLDDEDWLEQLLCDSKRPVQIIYAGKAHPRDDKGKELIKRIFHLGKDPRFKGRIVLIEDYDINVGRHLVQGVDVWLNNPRRPLEACGTSGQKVVLNGGLNCSTLDGWWAEAYDGYNGFAIGGGKIHKDVAKQDEREAIQLREVIEQEVVPMFYNRDEAGLPRKWISQMKHALVSLAWNYNAARMVHDYTQLCYLPAGGATTSSLPDESDLDLPSIVKWLGTKDS
ncbi:MAG: alpha-glucan family phosphorylase [Deltaproteobacteria bacterium]|nr:alpha-glucan family phosphorylase [Deltaproteobacteria bacterium]MBW1870646.1 alpha-glucan family phosphorylase [Deltaproteobacteria bacterium]